MSHSRAVAFRNITARHLPLVQGREGGAHGGTTMNLINRMRALATDDAGQDLLEYALLVGLIALVAVVAVTATGTSVKNVFNDVATKIKVPTP